MRTLLIGALAATLVGCSCLLPPQASMEACTDTSGSGCLNGMAFSRSIEPAPASSTTNSATIKINSAIATRTEQPSIAHVRDRPQFAEKKAKPTVIEAKVEAPASGRPAETSEPVIIKAKTTIGAKLEDPASAEFGATRKIRSENPSIPFAAVSKERTRRVKIREPGRFYIS